MKNQVLSIKQMNHLKELGVDTSIASSVLLFLDEDRACVGWDVEDHGKETTLYEVYHEDSETWMPCHMEILDAETGNYDHSFRDECGTFTLQDILELLPIFIVKDGLCYDLTSDMHNSMAYKRDWDSIEDDGLLDEDDFYLHTESDGSNLLKMAYRMLCWLAENGYLKGGDK